MAVTTEQQPYKTLRDTIFAEAGLLSLLATDANGNPWAAFNQPPDSDDRFPKFIWEVVAGASDQGVQVEPYDKHEDRLQFSIWIADPELMMDLTRAVNVLESRWLAGGMNSSHWVCNGLHKRTTWLEVIWDNKLIDGMKLFQYTSDWEYRFYRRQNVA